MLCRWDITNSEAGSKIVFTNLDTSVSMVCGTIRAELNEILNFFANEGSGEAEVIFTDGVYTGYMCPETHDLPPDETFGTAMAVNANVRA